MGDDDRPVDLGRVRRARARLEDTLRKYPEVRERTADFLRGDPALADLEAIEMGERTDKLVRIPLVLVEKADELIPHMQADPAYQQMSVFDGHVTESQGVRVTQTAVIRAALAVGLDMLRERYGLTESEITDQP